MKFFPAGEVIWLIVFVSSILLLAIRIINIWLEQRREAKGVEKVEQGDVDRVDDVVIVCAPASGSALAGVSDAPIDLPCLSRIKEASVEAIPIDPEIVNFNAFAPKEIVPGSSFQLDIWIHKAIDYKEVRERSFLLGRDQLVGCRNGVPVQRGKGLQVQVSIQGMTVVDPVDELCWYGSPANLTFHVKVPSRCRLGEHMGKAVISYQGLPVARLAFAVWVSRVPDQRVGPCSTSLFYPDTAFASYAEKDSEAVLGRTQGMKAVRPDIDIFMDVMSLRSGDLWRKELERHVPGKDAFLLFWSAHAAQSRWVDYEWRLALQKRGLDYIHPIPLTQPPHRPIPQKLQELHFRNMELVVAQGLRASGLN